MKTTSDDIRIFSRTRDDHRVCSIATHQTYTTCIAATAQRGLIVTKPGVNTHNAA